MRSTRFAFVAVLAVALFATPARAQVAWDTPMFVAPSTPTGWGLYLVDPAPGDGIGFMGTWRSSSDIGYRLGLAEGFGGDLAVFGGIDVSANLLQADADFPLDMDWVAGVGAGVGDYVLFSVPLGLTMGRLLQAETLTLNPYFAPRLVMDAAIGDAPGGDDLDLSFALDVGVDVSPAASWTIRFAGSLGDREALGIGVSMAP